MLRAGGTEARRQAVRVIGVLQIDPIGASLLQDLRNGCFLGKNLVVIVSRKTTARAAC